MPEKNGANRITNGHWGGDVLASRDRGSFVVVLPWLRNRFVAQFWGAAVGLSTHNALAKDYQPARHEQTITPGVLFLMRSSWVVGGPFGNKDRGGWDSDVRSGVTFWMPLELRFILSFSHGLRGGPYFFRRSRGPFSCVSS